MANSKSAWRICKQCGRKTGSTKPECRHCGEDPGISLSPIHPGRKKKRQVGTVPVTLNLTRAQALSIIRQIAVDL